MIRSDLDEWLRERAEGDGFHQLSEAADLIRSQAEALDRIRRLPRYDVDAVDDGLGCIDVMNERSAAGDWVSWDDLRGALGDLYAETPAQASTTPAAGARSFFFDGAAIARGKDWK